MTPSLVNNQLIIVNISLPTNLSTYLVEVTLSNPAGQFDETNNISFTLFGKSYITCYVVCMYYLLYETGFLTSVQNFNKWTNIIVITTCFKIYIAILYNVLLLHIITHNRY